MKTTYLILLILILLLASMGYSQTAQEINGLVKHTTPPIKLNGFIGGVVFGCLEGQSINIGPR